ncbi:MAG: tetratricopeptide repeat protein [Spirochaetia bacterium]
MNEMKVPELLSRVKNAIQLGDLELAERLVGKVVVQEPNHPAGYILLGTVEVNRHNYHKAVKSFLRALKIDQRNVEALNNLAVAYRLQGEVSRALASVKQALSISPNRGDIHYNLGNIYKQQKSYTKAVAAYKKTIELQPDFVLAYNNLGTVYEAQEDYEKAVHYYLKGLDIDTNHPTLRYNLGVAYQKTGKNEKAIAEFERALKIQPSLVNAKNNLAIVLQKQGKYGRAIRLFKEILRRDANHFEVKNNLGRIYLDQERLDEAEKMFRNALEDNPGYSLAAINLEKTLRKKGNETDALEALNQVLSEDSQNRNVLLRRGKLLISLGRYREAEKDYNKLLKMYPDSPDILQTVSTLYEHTGNYEKNSEIIQKLEGLGNADNTFYNELALVNKDKKNYSRAQKFVSKALEEEPGSLSSGLIRGQIYLEQDEYEKALENFQKLQEEHGNDSRILSAIANVKQKMGDNESALEVVDNMINRHGTKDGVENIDELNENLGLYEDTVKEYEQEMKDTWERNLEILRGKQEEVDESGDMDSQDKMLIEDDEEVPLLLNAGMEPLVGINEEEEDLILEEEAEELEEFPEEFEEIESESPEPFLKLLDDEDLYSDSMAPEYLESAGMNDSPESQPMPQRKKTEAPPEAEPEVQDQPEQEYTSGAEEPEPKDEGEETIQDVSPDDFEDNQGIEDVSPDEFEDEDIYGDEEAPQNEVQPEPPAPQLQQPQSQPMAAAPQQVPQQPVSQIQSQIQPQPVQPPYPQTAPLPPQYPYPMPAPGLQPQAEGQVHQPQNEPPQDENSLEDQHYPMPPHGLEWPGVEDWNEALEEEDDGIVDTGQNDEIVIFDSDSQDDEDDVIESREPEAHTPEQKEPDSGEYGEGVQYESAGAELQENEKQPDVHEDEQHADASKTGNEPETPEGVSSEGKGLPYGERRGRSAPEKRKEPADNKEIAQLVQLLDYLIELAHFLPKDKRKGLLDSDFRLKLEALKYRLTGKQGLLKKYTRRKEDLLNTKHSMSKNDLKNAFTFMENLSEYHPNHEVGVALKHKLHQILKVISEKGNGNGQKAEASENTELYKQDAESSHNSDEDSGNKQ